MEILKNFFDGAKNTKEVLFSFAGILTSIIYIGSKMFALHQHDVTLFIDALNALVLLGALFFIKETKLQEEHNSDDQQELTKLFGLNYHTIRQKTRQVDNSISQFVESLRYFLIILFLYYLMQFILDATHQFSNETITGVVKPFLHNCANIEAIIIDKEPGRDTALSYLYIEIIGNILNLLSSSFLFIAFESIYSKTLKTANVKSYRHYGKPLAVAGVIIFLNIILFLIDSRMGLNVVSCLIKLLCGLYAGVSMTLLFSRFIAMEYFFNKAKDWHPAFYRVGILAVLPFYAVVQPLYGLFDAVDIGDNEIFRSGVFLICLWGKLFFLLFVYTVIENRWIHSYLLMVLCNDNTQKKISLLFKSVKDYEIPPVVAFNQNHPTKHEHTTETFEPDEGMKIEVPDETEHKTNHHLNK